MKVLMLGWEFPPYCSGGLGTACEGLTKGLSEKGVDVTFVLPKASGDAKSSHVNLIVASNVYMDKDHVKFVEIRSLLAPYITSEQYSEKYAQYAKLKHGNMGDSGDLYGKNLYEEVNNYANKVELISGMEQYDLIHAHDWMTYPAAINAKKSTGKPLVVHIHATEFDRTGEHVNQQIYDIEREGFHAADKIIAVSNFTKTRLVTHYGVKPDKVQVVHNAVEFNDYEAEHCIKTDDKVVLFLGRITMQKGPEYFLYAAKRVLEMDPDVRFIVAGSGDLEGFMIQKAAELGIANRVLFAGYLKGRDIDMAYRMADIYVMPSVSEPFGITPLEAMRNGTPCLISKNSGVSEVLNHCLKVDFWDIDQMSNKIMAALNYSSMHKELKNNGLEGPRIQLDAASRAVHKCLQNTSIGGGSLKICMYFQVHQPWRLRQYNVFEIGKKHDYFDEAVNEKFLQRVAEKCYLPSNKIMLDLIKKYDGQFKIAFSITGVLIEQLKLYAPEVLASFKELVNTGHVELLSETYYHSLAQNSEEFKEQVDLHTKMLKSEFAYVPKVFRNTELIYSNKVAKIAQEMGYIGILAEGADKLLGWQSPNYVQNPKSCEIKVLLKNHKLSDDVAFRFSQKSWDEWPLDASKYASWLKSASLNGDVINLFMDYETFGEHHWKDTGIFKFLEHLPGEVFKKGGSFVTPTEAINMFESRSVIDVSEQMSWADVERDMSAWQGNDMQKKAFEQYNLIEQHIKECGDACLLSDWRRLGISDHFYYMSTKFSQDGQVHSYFNPYESPYEGFIAYMNVLNDMAHRINSDAKVCETPAALLTQ